MSLKWTPTGSEFFTSRKMQKKLIFWRLDIVMDRPSGREREKKCSFHPFISVNNDAASLLAK